MAELKTITEKLLTVQSKLKAPKNQKNSFGNYNYRSCEDIIEGVKPLLKEVGLILNLSDEITLIGDRYYLKAKASVSDGESVVEIFGYAREALNKKGMDESQITGTASSYARKYALNGLFAIDDTKDADATNDHKPQPVKKSTQERYKQIADGLIEAGVAIGFMEEGIEFTPAEKKGMVAESKRVLGKDPETDEDVKKAIAGIDCSKFMEAKE